MVETEAGYVVEGVVSTRCGRKGVLVRRAGGRCDANGLLHVLRHAAGRESMRSVVALSCAGILELLLPRRAGCSNSSLAPGLKVR